jgi:hypothetical protein
MAYDGQDRFRNWGPDEYEYRIKRLEAEAVFLKSDVITCREQKAVLSDRLRRQVEIKKKYVMHRFGF